jgi:hypothetical protein
LDNWSSITYSGKHLYIGNRVETGSGPHPISYLSGTGAPLLGVKWLKDEGDQTFQSLVLNEDILDLYLLFPRGVILMI